MAQTTNTELTADQKTNADLIERLAKLEKLLAAMAPAASAAPVAPGAPGYKPGCKAPYKKALYHNHFAKPHLLCILDENPDKTVTLGEEDGKPLITRVPVLSAPKPGHCTRGSKLPEPAEAAGEPAGAESGVDHFPSLD